MLPCQDFPRAFASNVFKPYRIRNVKYKLHDARDPLCEIKKIIRSHYCSWELKISTEIQINLLTWHKTLKEQGLDILEGHVLAHVYQVVASSGDSCETERWQIQFSIDKGS